MLVVGDDLSLPFGQIRLRAKGSSGGHNGLKSIIAHLGTEDFPRLRIGIGQSKGDTVRHVLGEFRASEKKELEVVINKAVKGCLMWLNKGVVQAMDQLNRRMEDGKK